jgi:hypothetical protein
VLGHRGLAHTQPPDELADRLLASREEVKDLAAPRLGDDVECGHGQYIPQQLYACQGIYLPATEAVHQTNWCDAGHRKRRDELIRGRVRPLASFLAGLRSFLVDEYSLDRALREVRAGLEKRDSNFLSMVEATIYNHPNSPYRPLLRKAGCELGDLAAGVRTNGLESTLVQLRREGVYVSFDEFKGRAPIVRGDIVVEARPEDFDNPLLASGYRARTSGSTGVSTPLWVSLASLANRIPHTLIALEAHGLLGAPCAMWREAPPAPAIGMILEEAPMGQRYERWFAPSMNRSRGTVAASRIATEAIVATARSAGVRLPRPERLDYEDADVVAAWAGKRGECVVRTGLSNALRVSLAATEKGIDLTGTAFIGAGEPVTATKIDSIERTGARWISNYTISEVGRVGVACANGSDRSDVHYAAHVAALITHPRVVPGSDERVDTFHFSSLLAGSPKVLLNTETDDYGIVSTRECGCPLEGAGLRQHLRQIFSFQKLTGEGVSLVGSDMVRILEDVLPRRFGGSAIDYQLIEEEGEHGFTRLTLVISPRVDIPDESGVIDTILQELGDSSFGRDVRSIWSRAGALRIRRAEPHVAQGGKVRPLIPRNDAPNSG